MSAAPVEVRPGSGAGVPVQTRAPGPARRQRRRRRSNPALTFVLLGCATMSYTTLRAGEVLLSDLLFLIAASIILVKMLTGNEAGLTPRSNRRGSSLFIAGTLVLLTAGTLSSFSSWEPFASMTVVLRFAWLTVIWCWIMRTVCVDREAFDRILGAWKLSSILTSIAAILGNMGIAFISTEAGGRQLGLSGHPNHLAGQLTATFALFLLAVPRHGGRMTRRERLSWIAALALCSTAMFASGSLTGLLALASGTLAVGVTFLVTRTPASPNRRRSPLAPMAALIGAMVGIALLMTSDLPVIDRLTRYSEGDQYVNESVDYRGETNSMVINRFDDFLLVGLGFNHDAGTAGVANGASPDDPSVRNYGVHNMVLGMLYQAGLPAVIGLFLILSTVARQLSVLLRRTDAHLYMAALALVGSFVAVNVNAMFQPTSFDRFYWMPVAMTGCLWSVRRRELREAAGLTV